MNRFINAPNENSGWCGLQRVVILLSVICMLAVSIAHSAHAATSLTVDGNQRFQTIDGFGVNANSLSWNNGELVPAVDLLADEMGATLWRVVFDMEDWEVTNDNSDANVFNWDYYNGVYSSAKFQNLWGTLGYLNQKGISSGIILSLMGRVPDWMGGSKINAADEDEWVEMVVSLVWYARTTMQLSFTQLDPLNEPDWNGYEGPQVDPVQYARLLGKLALKLAAVGLGDIKLVGPNTASVDVGVNSYMSLMMGDSALMTKIDHFGFHNYEGYADAAEQAIKSSAYPDRNFYMTEITTPVDILTVLNQGPAGIHIWDGYDSVYNHAVLMGYGSIPPNDAGDGPAPLAYDMASGKYSPRKTFYLYEQIFKYVPSGSVRIGTTPISVSAVFSAYYHQPSGRVTIVGTNYGASSISFSATLANLPAMAGLQFYWTGNSDPAKNFYRETDLVVTDGIFEFTAPPDSMFTLTGLVDGADLTPPQVSVTAPNEGAAVGGTVTVTASASDAAGVAGVRFLLDGVNLGGEIFSPPYSLLWDTKKAANGNHALSAVARDIGGNMSTSLPVTVTVFNQDTTPPTVSVASPLQDAQVSGIITLTATADDNVAVAGVRFLLDGAPFGAEVTAAPYSIPLDTRNISDGIHLLTATARDASGNSAASLAVSFRVINSPVTVVPIKLVQKVSNFTSSAQNLTATLPSRVTAGNLIVVSVSGWPNLPASPAVTDSLGNSYNIAGNVLLSQGAYSAIYYARNVTGGSDAVTVRTVSAGGQITMAVAEFSGVDTVSPLDKTAGIVGSGTTPSSGTMTPLQSGELVIGSGTHNGNTVTTAGSGFTMIAVPTEDSNTHQPLAMEYQVLNSVTPTAATFTLATAYAWTQNGALFKPVVQQGPDVTSPVVSITTPQNGATVSAAVTVAATATDNIDVARVEFYLDNVLQATITSPAYVWYWNTALGSNGVHTLAAKAYDAAGNAGQSGDIAVTVFNDITAPTVSISAPDNNATVSGTVTVAAVAIDNVAVSKVEFYLNGALQVTDTTAPYGFSWNTGGVSNGLSSLSAKAYDNAGNIGQSANVLVTVNNTVTDPPLPAITLVQKASSITSSSQNLAKALPSRVTAGNLIVVAVSGWPNLPAAAAVTDSLRNTYSIAGTVLLSQGAYSAIYYAKNVKGGTNTVTFRTTKPKGQISMVVAEFSGVDTVSPLDKAAGGVGAGTIPASGTMTPGTAGELLIGSGTHNGTTVTAAGEGFTMIAIPTEDSDSHQPLAMEYRVLDGTAPASAVFGLATGYPWTMNGALFKHK